MTLSTIAAVVLLQQTAIGSAVSNTVDSQSTPDRQITLSASTTVAQSTRRTFDFLDANGSGFLEQPESPFIGFATADAGQAEEVENALALALEGKTGQAASPQELEQFYGEADSDGDGRVSYAEYHIWSVPRLAELGVSLITITNPDS